MKDLILASASPRRASLLRQIGLRFHTLKSPLQEPPVEVESMVEEVALAKAREVYSLYPGSLVLGADTIVICEGKVLGKPHDAPEAAKMLTMLSGKVHRVITAVALVEEGRESVAQEETLVFFREIGEEEIRTYVASGEPYDKAGGYGIQETGAVFVRRIEGCYFNVVGLPLALFVKMFQQHGCSIWQKGGN